MEGEGERAVSRGKEIKPKSYLQVFQQVPAMQPQLLWCIGSTVPSLAQP